MFTVKIKCWTSTIQQLALLLLVTPLTQIPTPSFAADCTSSKCHADMGTKKFVHGPAATGDCTMCHVEKGKHKFQLAAEGEKLCYQCHEPITLDAVVHPPVKQGNCVGCHDPHQSDNRFTLRAPPDAKLCALCHEGKQTQHKVLHSPVADGDCLACHGAHSASDKHLLSAKGNDVCFQCHEDIQTLVTSSEHVHPPAQDACTDCHDPHGSPVKFHLHAKNNIRELCLECHDQIAAALEAPVQHAAVLEQNECTNCHNPHGSRFAPLLKRASLDICLTCHNKEIKTKDSTLMNIAELLKNNPDHHGPIRLKDCTKCHEPHGGSHFRLLRSDYPAEFYAPFKIENFALCLSCHEKEVFLSAETAKFTDFRNGNRNLHFLHVNKAVKGRTCRACHETHASKRPKHIREAVPFGKWMLPTNFKKTATGGSCLPGCHKEKEYDRKNPVQY